ncbi:tyrosine-type recombinase/integrase [Natrinema halophilum]|uniref:Tyrosine-type recombinase/integrase n=1 Tax=Natrinema halophilum TaxID=1699371 RepID=A0A7D5GL17_9EURY|nr:tyrosine-type recombinase/integrase [Natrinema halophilum]QLG49112.1 site-specific integrase [Natrinema halophilum]
MPDKQLALDRLVEQIEDGERDVSDADRELLLDFSKALALVPSRIGVARHEKLLRHCTILAERSDGLADVLDDREAAEHVVRVIHQEYDNVESNKDNRNALRAFGRFLTPGDDVPESLEWIPTGTSSNYNPIPDPGDMLEWDEDVRPMIDATMNARDAALIAVAWDGGPRSGELLGLTVGDVTDHKHGLQITVDGKKGQRSITLITSVPYLNRWLTDHPRSDDPNALLWCKLQNGEEMSYQMAAKIPKKAAERAGITKPVTFTNFRKSSASHLASQGVNQAVLEDHHGWTRGSKAASRYISVFAEASDRELARAHGLDVEVDEPEPTAAVVCDRCEKETPRHEPFCMWCHQALEHGAVDEIEREQDEQRRQLLGLAKEHPELLASLEDLEPLVEALGGDPDVIETARQFVDAVDADS